MKHRPRDSQNRAHQHDSGRRQGEILVEMRCITQKNLEFALELQFETKLYETFLWTSGEYRFNAAAPAAAADAASK